MPARGPGPDQEEGIDLLGRAAEVGLLTAYGGGYYGIHPALPWLFKGLFERCYPAGDLAAVRAFVEVMGELGNYYHNQYGAGNRDVLAALRAEEANLLHARRLARVHGWWQGVLKAMQGLRQLYDHTGRRAEWKRLVEEIVPDFVDPGSDGPLPEMEEDWNQVTNYRVRLARQERQRESAERLHNVLVSWDRRRAASALARPAEDLESNERNAIRTLAASLHELGQIRSDLGRAECLPAFEEAFELSERIGERTSTATCAFNLGNTFRELPALRDLDRAEGWYRRSLKLFDERDGRGRGLCVMQLGHVAHERFREARTAERPAEELLRYLNEALRRYQEALDLLPVDAVEDLAVTHNALGANFGEAGDFDRRSVHHLREAVQLYEQAGNLYDAAQTRFNVAIALARAGRRADALEYAEAALRGFEPYGVGAADDIEETRALIAEIRGA